MNLARANKTRRNNIWFLCLCQIHRLWLLLPDELTEEAEVNLITRPPWWFPSVWLNGVGILKFVKDNTGLQHRLIFRFHTFFVPRQIFGCKRWRISYPCVCPRSQDIWGFIIQLFITLNTGLSCKFTRLPKFGSNFLRNQSTESFKQ